MHNHQLNAQICLHPVQQMDYLVLSQSHKGLQDTYYFPEEITQL